MADARVKDSSATSNYGTATEIRARLSSSSSNYESYLKFDLSSVTGGISSARLRLYGHLDSTSILNVLQGIFAVSNTTWTETGITWSTKPATTTSPLATVVVPDGVLRFYEWDLTSYIQSEKSAGRNLVSLALKSTAVSSPYTIFNSKEASSNGPQLVVTVGGSTQTGLGALPMSPPRQQKTSSPQIQLTVAASALAGWPSQLRACYAIPLTGDCRQGGPYGMKSTNVVSNTRLAPLITSAQATRTLAAIIRKAPII